jgi:hypothetical protein
MEKSNVLVDEEIICSGIDESEFINSALYYINKVFYEHAFWLWLQNNRSFNPNVDTYSLFETPENWKQFLIDEKNKGKKAHSEYLKEKAKRHKEIFGSKKKSKK